MGKDGHPVVPRGPEAPQHRLNFLPDPQGQGAFSAGVWDSVGGRFRPAAS